MIFPGAMTSSGARIGFGSNSKLSSDDVEAIRREVRIVAYVSATIRTRRAGHLREPELVHVDPGRRRRLAAHPVVEPRRPGSSSRTRTTARPPRSCVLGKTVATNLFGDEDPVGKTIRIKNIPFRVVGVLDAKGGSMMGQDQDDLVIAPYETVRKKLMGTTAVGSILASAASNEQVDSGSERDHGAPAPAPPDQQGDGPGRRLHDPVADGDARAGRSAEPHDVDAPLVDRGRLAPRRRDRDHEHHARLGDGADPRDRRAHGDRRQGRGHSRAVPRRGRRPRDRGRRRRDRARPRRSSASSPGSRAGRSRSSRPRSRSPSRSRPSSGSRSVSTRRSRRAGWTRSRRSGTSSGTLARVGGPR